MKKLISLVLILCMACMLVPAMADEDLTGDWYASFAGAVMTMTVNADGTLTMLIPGQAEASPGTWTLEGDQITITVQDSPATGTVTADGIALSEGGMDLLFTREPIGAITVADVKADAAEEEFYGEWTMTYLGAEGMILDAASAGMVFPNIKLGKGTVEFIPSSDEDLYALMFSLLGLTSSYADGKLALTATTEGADATGTVEMLTDGMIKVSLDDDDGPMVMYYSPAAAAEEPAA